MTNREHQLAIKDIALLDGMPGKLADLIAAQAAHETGYFTSKAFLQNNNLFGYKYVQGGRWQSGAGRTSTEGDPYAQYDTVEDSVHELTAWIVRRQKQGKFPPDLTTIQTPQEYARLLKSCGYYGAPESEYVNGLAHAMKSIDNTSI